MSNDGKWCNAKACYGWSHAISMCGTKPSPDSQSERSAEIPEPKPTASVPAASGVGFWDEWIGKRVRVTWDGHLGLYATEGVVMRLDYGNRCVQGSELWAKVEGTLIFFLCVKSIEEIGDTEGVGSGNTASHPTGLTPETSVLPNDLDTGTRSK